MFQIALKCNSYNNINVIYIFKIKNYVKNEKLTCIIT